MLCIYVKNTFKLGSGGAYNTPDVDRPFKKTSYVNLTFQF